MGDVVVSGHQVNLLPGLSVIEKARAADIFIWCDRFQAVRHGWFNRNRLADGTPITVPLDHRDWSGPISDCRIGNDAQWRRKMSKTLELKLGAESVAPYVEIIRRPWQRIVGLNAALLRRLCLDLHVDTEWVFQSHLESGQDNPLRALPADSVDDGELAPVSLRLAEMVAEVGGTVWLSGPSGRNYLDERPFLERGITVDYWEHTGPNPSAVELLRERAAA